MPCSSGRTANLLRTKAWGKLFRCWYVCSSCGMLSELIDFELAKEDLKMSTEESARLSWEMESRSKLSQLMLKRLEERSKMSSSLNSVSVPMALSTFDLPTMRSYLDFERMSEKHEMDLMQPLFLPVKKALAIDVTCTQDQPSEGLHPTHLPNIALIIVKYRMEILIGNIEVLKHI